MCRRYYYNTNLSENGTHILFSSSECSQFVFPLLCDFHRLSFHPVPSNRIGRTGPPRLQRSFRIGSPFVKRPTQPVISYYISVPSSPLLQTHTLLLLLLPLCHVVNFIRLYRWASFLIIRSSPPSRTFALVHPLGVSLQIYSTALLQTSFLITINPHFTYFMPFIISPDS